MSPAFMAAAPATNGTNVRMIGTKRPEITAIAAILLEELVRLVEVISVQQLALPPVHRPRQRPADRSKRPIE